MALTDEEQIAADLAPGPHDVPEEVLTYTPPEESNDFDTSQAFLHGEGSENQKHLAAIQREHAAAQARFEKLLSTWHGIEPENVGDLRKQVDRGEISGSDYYAMTGRIYAGGTGDTATRDARGNITGYTSRDGSGSALGGPSSTPGLDAFHEMNPDAPSSPGFSFIPDSSSPSSLPGSVAAHVGAPAPGRAMAVDTLTYDTRLQAPTMGTITGPRPDGTRQSLSNNDRLAEAAWSRNQQTANASLRANFKAAGLPDPTIPASVLRSAGGGTSVTPGNVGAQAWKRWS